MDRALIHAREAVARFEEQHGHDPDLPARIRAGKCDRWERVARAREAVLLAEQERDLR